jgi:hypothetical protein
MSEASEVIIGWHFVRADGCLRDGTRVERGGIYRLPEGTEPVLCRRGFHASRRAIDALRFAPGPLVTRVALSGTVHEERDKIVGSVRTVLAGPVDASRVLREFACDCAERALARVADPDPRSLAAVTTARRYARGEADAQDLAAAEAAAQDTARDAVATAAVAAAWAETRGAAEAALRAAALSAAEAAAWGAAESAVQTLLTAHAGAVAVAWAVARDAEWGAGRSTARGAARDAAEAAERDWQRDELERRLLAALEVTDDTSL